MKSNEKKQAPKPKIDSTKVIRVPYILVKEGTNVKLKKWPMGKNINDNKQESNPVKQKNIVKPKIDSTRVIKTKPITGLFSETSYSPKKNNL